MHMTILHIKESSIDKIITESRTTSKTPYATASAVSAAIGAPAYFLGDVITADPLVLAAVFQESKPFDNIVSATPRSTQRLYSAIASGEVNLPDGASFTEPEASTHFRLDLYSGRSYRNRSGNRDVEVMHIQLDEAAIASRTAKVEELRKALEAQQKIEAKAATAEMAAQTAVTQAQAELAALEKYRKQRAEAEGKLLSAKKVGDFIAVACILGYVATSSFNLFNRP